MLAEPAAQGDIHQDWDDYFQLPVRVEEPILVDRLQDLDDQVVDRHVTRCRFFRLYQGHCLRLDEFDQMWHQVYEERLLFNLTKNLSHLRGQQFERRLCHIKFATVRKRLTLSLMADFALVALELLDKHCVKCVQVLG